MTIDELLARARRRLDRVTVDSALDAVRDGAVIVDIRSEVQRASHGVMPGAIFHPRNVLEWRCDASSGHDDPRLSGDPGRHIILVCNEGYQSSLAAATLQDLGFRRATDLVGGFQAWAAAGLPVLPARGLAPVRVLLTGMSGAGKSTMVRELRRRGHAAYDADDDGFSEPRGGGRWGWRADLVGELLGRHTSGPMFFAGCSEEQAWLPFDFRVLLTAPEPVLLQRLRTRAGNPYGRDETERQQVLADLATIEPVLRRSADLVLVTTAPQTAVIEELLAHVLARAATA